MDEQAKKLFNAKAWAIDAPTNRAELDDPNITPQIDRAEGWGSTYSQQNGDLPDRRHFNQILCETISAALLVKDGVPRWDSDVNYPQHAITNEKGILWRAKVNTGPATSNAIDPSTPNQNVWEQTSQSRNTPDAPESFHGTTPAKNTIVAQWKAGEDNGAKITSWRFQHALATESWPTTTPEILQYPYKKLTGLAAGSGYKVRARAINDVGDGEWGESTIGATGFTTTGTVPDGGNLLALLATAGDGSVVLTWKEPDNGGYPVVRYDVEWVESERTWQSANGDGTTSTTITINNLQNGQEYQFRVRARNQIGEGEWSNTAVATPIASVVSTYNPSLGAPTLGAASTTTITAQPNETPSVVGKTAAVTQYNWQVRKQGESNWSAYQPTTSKTFTFENLDHSTTYEVRYTVTTSLGTTNNSPASSATTLTPAQEETNEVQPTLLAPSASYQTNGNGANVSSRHNSDVDGYSLFTIISTTWQYRRVGVASWTTHSSTNRSISIDVNLTQYAYEFRFRYTTTGGRTAFSPTARLNKQDTPPRVTNLSIRFNPTSSALISGWRVDATWNYSDTSTVRGSKATQIKWTGIPTYTTSGIRTQDTRQIAKLRTGGPSTISVSVRFKNHKGWGPWSTRSISNK